MRFDIFKALDRAIEVLPDPIVSVRSHADIYMVRIETIVKSRRLTEQLSITQGDMLNNDYGSFNLKLKSAIERLKRAVDDLND